MGFIGTTISAQSKPPTSVKWSKLFVIYPFVSPCSRMQGGSTLEVLENTHQTKMKQSENKSREKKEVI